MKKIRMLSTESGPKGHKHAGNTYIVDDIRADELVSCGSAILVEEIKEAKKRPERKEVVEEATVEKREKAVKRRRRKKNA